MKHRASDFLFWITILFFALGFFNMLFAWLGLACLLLPLILLAKHRKKTWCHGICPRAKLYTVLFGGRSITGKSAPKWFTHGRLKWFVLVYFLFNLFVMVMSTVMVAVGRIEPMETLRFLIAFQLPWQMPQLLELGAVPGWAVHFAFRIYSMMMTTTVIGLILGWAYKPRTWCAICPINTLSAMALHRQPPNGNAQDNKPETSRHFHG